MITQCRPMNYRHCKYTYSQDYIERKYSGREQGIFCQEHALALEKYLGCPVTNYRAHGKLIFLPQITHEMMVAARPGNADPDLTERTIGLLKSTRKAMTFLDMATTLDVDLFTFLKNVACLSKMGGLIRIDINRMGAAVACHLPEQALFEKDGRAL